MSHFPAFPRVACLSVALLLVSLPAMVRAGEAGERMMRIADLSRVWVEGQVGRAAEAGAQPDETTA